MYSPPTLTSPVFEHHHNGFGIGHRQPRVSWRFVSSQDTAPAWRQTAYEIEVGIILSSGISNFESFYVESEDSVLVPWPAKVLRSREAVTVRVRSFGKSDSEQFENSWTPWSSRSPLEVGLLERKDWTAHFITPSQRFGPAAPLQPIRFYKQFKLPQIDSKPLKARLYITSLGVFDAYVNGQPTSNECLAPGWTSYRHRLVYRAHDVSSSLIQGTTNTICVEVGEGWYAGQLGIQGGGRFLYGSEDLGVLAQLEIHLGDDQLAVITSDNTWQASPSAIQSSEIYNGEIYDMRSERPNWRTSKPDEVVPCRQLPWIHGVLVAPDGPPVRVVEQIRPLTIFRSTSGRLIVDYGQNLVGKLVVRSVNLPEGDSLILKHAEVMEHGELGTRPLRAAKCTDIITSAGSPIIDWSPRFTYHGFRYVEVQGWPETSEQDILLSLIAVVMQSDMKRRGYFECSNPWLNRLHQNIVWSMRGNFFSIPTDCPQRPERLGWTGDLNLFCPTASFLYNTVGMLGDWLQDLSAEHLEESRNGIPPLVVPDVLWTSLFPRNIAQAIWDDTTVMTPWTLFQYSDDTALLERQFESMETWLNQGIPRAADGLWEEGWQFADWLDPSAPPDDPGHARTDGVLVANCFMVHITERMAKICAILGREELSDRYTKDADRLKQVFQHKYISPHGNIMANTQTALALAIHFGLYKNADQVQVAGAALEKLVRAARFHIATGFAGTPLITHALTRVGKPDLAYRMLLEKTCPSWLYPITMGATTVWERWDSMLPNGSINPGAMTSFNHYALGAVADWMHGTIGGISPLEPGWKKIQVRPIPGGNLKSARVEFDGPHGLISCTWNFDKDEARFEMTLVVPPNSKAAVILPFGTRDKPFGIAGETDITVKSGTHHFTCECHVGEWPPTKFIPPFLPRQTEDTIADQLEV